MKKSIAKDIPNPGAMLRMLENSSNSLEVSRAGHPE